MIITITGPRSVGKSTISKLVAKKLNLKYVSSDEIGDKAMKKSGGLDKATKSGEMKKVLEEKGYTLILKEYKKNNFVFDLSGGSFAYPDFPSATLGVRETAKKNSIIIGLLPFKEKKKSVELLFEREKGRKHLKDANFEELLKKTKKRYDYFPPYFKEYCDKVVYVGERSPEDIAEEIVSFIKS